MFVSPVYVATVALLSFRSLVDASPLVASARGIWNPHITSPTAGDVWKVGSTLFVTWETHDAPPSARNDTGSLLLGYFDGNSSGENLNTHHPLAEGFLLTDGHIRIEVPNVKPRDTYIVVLMGNSGNASPEFKITHPHSKPATTHKSSDKAVSWNDDDPKADPVETRPSPNNIPVSVSCKGRSSSSGSRKTQKSAHSNSAPGQNNGC